MLARFKGLVSGVLLVLACVVAAQAADKPNTRVVAVVNGSSITEPELNQEIARLLPGSSFHGGVSEERKAQLRSEALQKLVELELQAQDARAKGIKVGEDELKAEVDSQARRFNSKKEFKAALVAAGFDEKSFARFVERNMIAPRIIKAEVDAKVVVTDEGVKAYYDKNRAGYNKPEEFRASHILFRVDPAGTAEERAAVRKRADEALKRIRAGENFADVAAQESDDPTRVKGGDLGYFHAGQAPEGIDEVLAKMKVGDTSDVIQILQGYDIIRLTERKPPRQIPFEEISGKIRSDMIGSEKTRLFEQWMTGLKAKAVISYPKETKPVAGAK